MNRRSFISSMLAAGATPLMPGCFSAKGYKANGKVRLAAIDFRNVLRFTVL